MSRSASNRRRRGSASLEFALVGAALIVLITVCMDLARMVATRTALRAAVAEVVRHSMANTDMAGCGTPETHALARVTVLTARDLTICVTRGTNSVTVTGTYAFSYVVPLLGTAPRTLRATVTSPV